MKVLPRKITIATLATTAWLGACVQYEDQGPLDGEPASALAATPTNSTLLGERTPDQLDTVWTGTYSVPVPAEDLELVDAARYDVGAIAGHVVDTGATRSLEVSFTLPAALLGADATIVLAGPLPSAEALAAGELVAVSGFDGAGTCALAPTLACDISYYQASVDLVAVKNHWIDRGATSAQISARLRVAQLFDADPLGVLEGDVVPSRR
jgi:hypothetical protein